MFNSKRIKALEKRVAALEQTAQPQQKITLDGKDLFEQARQRVLKRCQSLENSHS